MKAQELLSKYPLAAKVVKDWFLEKMMESMNTDSVPEEFKQSILAEGISDDRLATVIDAQPRTLFDVFLENNIQIGITVISSLKEFEGFVYFNYEIFYSSKSTNYRELEKIIIENCFEKLENILISL